MDQTGLAICLWLNGISLCSISPLLQEKLKYMLPVEESVKAMISWGWAIELDATRAVTKAQLKRKMSKASAVCIIKVFAPRYGV